MPKYFLTTKEAAEYCCVPVRIIQAWMGHSTVTVTEQYTRAVGAHANEYIERLE